MKKTTHINNMPYIFNPTRKGAKYSINGGKTWMNHGEFCEVLAKFVLGYAPVKDANTKFNEGHDIDELRASVKSWNCGLTDMKLGSIPSEYLKKFFEMSDHATTYMWVSDHDEMVDIYYMNESEFKAFVETCASWDSYCSKFRFKKSANNMIAYLESLL